MCNYHVCNLLLKARKHCSPPLRIARHWFSGALTQSSRDYVCDPETSRDTTTERLLQTKYCIVDLL